VEIALVYILVLILKKINLFLFRQQILIICYNSPSLNNNII